MMSVNQQLHKALRQQLSEAAITDSFALGCYATDASIYQFLPQAVVIPQTWQQVEQTLDIANHYDTSLTARGAGTSQAGQATNKGIIVNFKKQLNKILHFSHQQRLITVQPGLVLDQLNRFLKPYGLWFPVDISTSFCATIGGMAANNAAGSRSLRYGMMRHNIDCLEVMYSNGNIEKIHPLSHTDANSPLANIWHLIQPHAKHLLKHRPKVSRNVAGFSLDALINDSQSQPHTNQFFIGSEGTLVLFKSITLKLKPIIDNSFLVIVHFAHLQKAMNAVQHLLALKPNAIELVDHNMLTLCQHNSAFNAILKTFVKGNPKALLLVEFSGNQQQNQQSLEQTQQVLHQLGIHWKAKGDSWGGVKAIESGYHQAQIWELRKQGLNIMMSMKTAAKPIAFIEDCALPVQHLAAYTQGLEAIFQKYKTSGVFYGHASVGTLHVRPLINLKQQQGLSKLKPIMEEATDLVQQFKGSHSGEHGDGIIRSHLHSKMLSPIELELMQKIKQTLDPNNRLNPGRIVNPPQFDEPSILRYPPHYQTSSFKGYYDWQAWQTTPVNHSIPLKTVAIEPLQQSAIRVGLQAAVEMCNSNGTCLKQQGGIMCPSYRASLDESDSVRARATTLRLALSGQLGEDALINPQINKVFAHCVSCKACQSECPMNIDMAKMKAEVKAFQINQKGLTLADKLIAYLPYYAEKINRLAPLLNWINSTQSIRKLSEPLTQISSQRSLPLWQTQTFRQGAKSFKPSRSASTKIFLFSDTFNNTFESENLLAAQQVLEYLDFEVMLRPPHRSKQPLCCGRTLIATGLLAKARQQLTHTTQQFKQLLGEYRIVGIEPSCILTFHDEAIRLVDNWTKQDAKRVLLIDQLLMSLDKKRQIKLQKLLHKIPASTLHLHNHCHQKAAKVDQASIDLLKRIPNSHLKVIDSGCCGMAGEYGYRPENQLMSEKMARLSLIPHIEKYQHQPQQVFLATGTSCRCQIDFFSTIQAQHPIRLLAQALAT